MSRRVFHRLVCVYSVLISNPLLFKRHYYIHPEVKVCSSRIEAVQNPTIVIGFIFPEEAEPIKNRLIY